MVKQIKNNGKQAVIGQNIQNSPKPCRIRQLLQVLHLINRPISCAIPPFGLAGCCLEFSPCNAELQPELGLVGFKIGSVPFLIFSSLCSFFWAKNCLMSVTSEVFQVFCLPFLALVVGVALLFLTELGLVGVGLVVGSHFSLVSGRLSSKIGDLFSISFFSSSFLTNLFGVGFLTNLVMIGWVHVPVPHHHPGGAMVGGGDL